MVLDSPLLSYKKKDNFGQTMKLTVGPSVKTQLSVTKAKPEPCAGKALKLEGVSFFSLFFFLTFQKKKSSQEAVRQLSISIRIQSIPR